MKAYYYMDDLGKVIEQRDIPEDMRELAEEYRTNLLEMLQNMTKSS